MDCETKLPCATCAHWKRQNRVMGRCTYPLPASLHEIVGSVVMKRGVYQWVGSVHQCAAYSRHSAEGSP